MEDNKTLQLVYTFFVGILIALFIGVGISTFYAEPASPKYPVEINSYGKELTAEQEEKLRALDTEREAYNERMKPYNRNVSVIVLIAAVMLLVASILLEKKIQLLSDGIMLGGLFSLIYGIGRGFASQNTRYVFVVISLGLATVLYLGYHRFVSKPAKRKA